jgi:hypothetical protein
MMGMARHSSASWNPTSFAESLRGREVPAFAGMTASKARLSEAPAGVGATSATAGLPETPACAGVTARSRS